ncbi:MAG: hypothetical protein JSW07_00340 [bacterium]|nr:MAG: hypothetical protein JSW07_00340 [bacterium]
MKFTPENGLIEVKVTVGQNGILSYNSVQIQVKDSGIGILAEHLPRIFDRFYQADDVTTRKYGEAGIGLALVKELVELHHGTIDVESQQGQGSIFAINLSVGKDHLKPEDIIETPVIDATEISSNDT